MKYEKVRQAFMLTFDGTVLYQFLCDFLMAERDQGRWTSFTAIQDHALRHWSGAEAVSADRLRSALATLGEWNIVQSDNDSEGVRSIREYAHGRTKYQLTHDGVLTLRFRDELLGNDSGSLNESRPAEIFDSIRTLYQFVARHGVAGPLTTKEHAQELSALWVSISDAARGMQIDADRFLGRVEERVANLAAVIEVQAGETHPLIAFREWFETYTAKFITEVQRLRTYGAECMHRLEQVPAKGANGEVIGGAAWLRQALKAVSPQGLISPSEVNAEAAAMLGRLKTLVSPDGACDVLIARTHGALNRYLSAVRRVRIRLGADASGSKARLYSALAAKVAHASAGHAIGIASLLLPRRLNDRMLHLPAFPTARPDIDPWRVPPVWDVPLPTVTRGRPDFVAASPVAPAPDDAIDRMRIRAAEERRETAFWDRLLGQGSFDVLSLEVSPEEALWFHKAIVFAMSNPRREFRLKTGRVVRLVHRDEPEEVTLVRVPEVGVRMMTAIRLEVNS